MQPAVYLVRTQTGCTQMVGADYVFNRGRELTYQRLRYTYRSCQLGQRCSNVLNTIHSNILRGPARQMDLAALPQCMLGTGCAMYRSKYSASESVPLLTLASDRIFGSSGGKAE